MTGSSNSSSGVPLLVVALDTNGADSTSPSHYCRHLQPSQIEELLRENNLRDAYAKTPYKFTVVITQITAQLPSSSSTLPNFLLTSLKTGRVPGSSPPPTLKSKQNLATLECPARNAMHTDERVAAPGLSGSMHGSGLMSLHVEGGTQVQVPRSLMQAFLQQDPNHPGLETVRLPTPPCGSDENGPPQHCREVETELCLVCRRCGRAYPQESTLLAHQRSCYLGNQQRRGALRLCGEEVHPLTDEMEDVVNQITLLAARAAAESTTGQPQACERANQDNNNAPDVKRQKLVQEVAALAGAR
ncbi:hypothetical protein WH47_10340 [Habropoda laboriosa]|uniref:C2H2-type domain-containing protein n=1 Tax=Habropoda laboriosa TaxID=597456 RepID=A0A0L7R4V8_9HYME|nr:hypothetical protein WH47_10340 [Habropoda laboriosa]